MEHAELWYKRKAYFLSFAIGLLLAIGLNIDTIGITRTLWENPTLREQVALTAEYYVQQDDADQQAKAQEEYKKLDAIGFPVGWSFENVDNEPEAPYNMQDFRSRRWGGFRRSPEWLSRKVLRFGMIC